MQAGGKMKFLGFKLGKEKVVSFQQFRDAVRLTARRNYPGAVLEATDNGFNLTVDGRAQTCNLRGIYAAYAKNPEGKDTLIVQYLNNLIVEPPKHSWMDAQMLLRPTLKSANFIADANRSLAKNKEVDSLPAQPFIGDLSAIIVTELPGQVAAITQGLLDNWGVTLEQAATQALNNMSMMSFPNVNNVLVAGGAVRKNVAQEEVGLVFEGDHLTATWLLSERFRQYVGQRLQGDYVVAVPSRSKLTAVRADEPGLVASVQQANRNFATQPYALTSQLFHVSASTTGGVVTVFQPAAGSNATLDPNSLFAAGKQGGMPTLSHQMASEIPGNGDAPRDLNTWFGLTESTVDSTPPPTSKSGAGKSGGR